MGSPVRGEPSVLQSPVGQVQKLQCLCPHHAAEAGQEDLTET